MQQTIVAHNSIQTQCQLKVTLTFTEEILNGKVFVQCLRKPAKHEKFKNKFLLDHGVPFQLKWRKNLFL